MHCELLPMHAVLYLCIMTMELLARVFLHALCMHNVVQNPLSMASYRNASCPCRALYACIIWVHGASFTFSGSKRLEKQQPKNQELLALQSQCQYMSDEEKKWWFDQGIDPTKEIVEYGRYQQYLQCMGSDGTGHQGSGPKPTPKPTPRRSRLSAGEELLYQNNPAIAGLGLHNIGTTSDGCEAIRKCLLIASRIKGSGHGARRVASEPEAYFQENSWEEYLSYLVDEINYCGWDFEESIPFLCKGLRKGDGLVAVEQLKADFGLKGNWRQLIETCTYLFAARGQHDPMIAFKKRVQLKSEPARGFGLTVTRLLKKVHPA